MVDITPPPGFPMGGFGSSGKISRGVWTPLKAKANYIRDKDGNALFMLGTVQDVTEAVQTQNELDLYLTDIDSLINRAKASMSSVLTFSLISALILIGLVMGRIFRSKEMVIVGFMVNAIPIAWFGLIINILNFPLTIEALIAMTIALALGSDATVHFAYKYLRGRYFGRTQKHSLEIMFFYAGIPVIIGSLVLSIVFISLTFTSLYSLQLIGGYGAVLMIFSLATDLFILPVMLLAYDRYFKVK